jgi:large subunit ribosomal protein L7/L12
MAIERADVVEYVKNLSVMELSGLIKELEDELGVSAAAPMMAAAMPAAGGAAVEEEEEQTEFDVEVTTVGDKKIQVIKAFREIDKSLGLKEAKTLAESVPAKILEGATKEEAEAAKEKLEGAGATVEIK